MISASQIKPLLRSITNGVRRWLPQNTARETSCERLFKIQFGNNRFSCISPGETHCKTCEEPFHRCRKLAEYSPSAFTHCKVLSEYSPRTFHPCRDLPEYSPRCFTQCRELGEASLRTFHPVQSASRVLAETFYPVQRAWRSLAEDISPMPGTI